MCVQGCMFTCAYVCGDQGTSCLWDRVSQQLGVRSLDWVGQSGTPETSLSLTPSAVILSKVGFLPSFFLLPVFLLYFPSSFFPSILPFFILFSFLLLKFILLKLYFEISSIDSFHKICHRSFLSFGETTHYPLCSVPPTPIPLHLNPSTPLLFHLTWDYFFLSTFEKFSGQIIGFYMAYHSPHFHPCNSFYPHTLLSSSPSILPHHFCFGSNLLHSLLLWDSNQKVPFQLPDCLYSQFNIQNKRFEVWIHICEITPRFVFLGLCFTSFNRMLSGSISLTAGFILFFAVQYV